MDRNRLACHSKPNDIYLNYIKQSDTWENDNYPNDILQNENSSEWDQPNVTNQIATW